MFKTNIIDLAAARNLKAQGDPNWKNPEKTKKKPTGRFTVNFEDVGKSISCRTTRELFARLEKWFRLMPQGFYKFMAPCKNKTYRKGDSLCEEMGLDRKTIQRASKKIVTVYESKALYLSAKGENGEEGAFQGKPYLSYFDNCTHQTFYHRNPDVAESILNGSYRALQGENVSCRKGQNVSCARGKKSLADALEAAVHKALSPPTYDTTYDSSLSISLSEQNSIEQPKREIKNQLVREQPKQPTAQVVNEMVKIWIKETGCTKDTQLHKNTVATLNEAFSSNHINSSMDEWTSYCKDIAANDFLMGKKKLNKGGYYQVSLTYESQLHRIEKNKRTEEERNPPPVLSPAEAYNKTALVQHAHEEEHIRNCLDESDDIKAIRLKLLNKLRAANYSDNLKGCEIEACEDTLFLRPSSRYKAKYIASHMVKELLVTLLSDSPFRRLNIFQKDGDLVFDKWFEAEAAEKAILPVIETPKILPAPLPAKEMEPPCVDKSEESEIENPEEIQAAVASFMSVCRDKRLKLEEAANKGQETDVIMYGNIAITPKAVPQDSVNMEEIR